MIWTHLLVVAVLFGTGTYLLLQRELTRVVIGLSLLAHGANLALLVTAGPPGEPPLLLDGAEGPFADPLPQAFALTAVVIVFGTTALLLAIAHRSWVLTGGDEVADDVEDRRIAREGAEDEVADDLEEARAGSPEAEQEEAEQPDAEQEEAEQADDREERA